MEAHARAAVDIYGRILRYAEVEQYGSRYRLLRLGSCDFDFDVVRDVLHAEDAEQVKTVSEALQDVFSGSIAGTLNVTLHPPGCYSFFCPLPFRGAASDRKVRLQQEVALLAGPEQRLHITADAVRGQQLSAGDRVDWVHVLAVEDRVQARLNAVLNGLSQPRRRMMVGMQAAAAAVNSVRRPSLERRERGPGALAIGWYPDHVEYVLCSEGQWYFSKYTDPVPPVDVAYFSVSMIDRFGLRPAEVERLYVYGNDVDVSLFSDLESVFDIEARRLNPLSIVDLDTGSLSSDFEAEAYVGCVGATL